MTVPEKKRTSTLVPVLVVIAVLLCTLVGAFLVLHHRTKVQLGARLGKMITSSIPVVQQDVASIPALNSEAERDNARRLLAAQLIVTWELVLREDFQLAELGVALPTILVWTGTRRVPVPEGLGGRLSSDFLEVLQELTPDRPGTTVDAWVDWYAETWGQDPSSVAQSRTAADEELLDRLRQLDPPQK